jgi:type IV secretory pathway VirB2 component (pilin)
MRRQAVWSVAVALLLVAGEALAQASPFSDGADAFQDSFLAILTPVAVIAVMGLGAAAWFNRISWAWAITGVAGIVLVFGAPQIIVWIRGMFGV